MTAVHMSTFSIHTRGWPTAALNVNELRAANEQNAGTYQKHSHTRHKSFVHSLTFLFLFNFCLLRRLAARRSPWTRWWNSDNCCTDSIRIVPSAVVCLYTVRSYAPPCCRTKTHVLNKSWILTNILTRTHNQHKHHAHCTQLQRVAHDWSVSTQQTVRHTCDNTYKTLRKFDSSPFDCSNLIFFEFFRSMAWSTNLVAGFFREQRRWHTQWASVHSPLAPFRSTQIRKTNILNEKYENWTWSTDWNSIYFLMTEIMIDATEILYKLNYDEMKRKIGRKLLRQRFQIFCWWRTVGLSSWPTRWSKHMIYIFYVHIIATHFL